MEGGVFFNLIGSLMEGGVVLPGRSLRSPGDEAAASHDMSSERNIHVMV